MKRKMIVDGEKYWLGAIWAIYRAKYDSFDYGNGYIPRSQTVFARFEVTL